MASLEKIGWNKDDCAIWVIEEGMDVEILSKENSLINTTLGFST